MAKVGKNIVTPGFRGKLGDIIVFRRRWGKTIVTTTPEKTAHELTAAQKKHRHLFQNAILYGKNAVADPIKNAAYKGEAKDGQSAYNVAVADFLNAPSFDEVDVSKYNGQPGSTIKILVTDDFKVIEVQVEIYNGDGVLVESGATIQPKDKVDWIYTATKANASTDGDKIVIKASDIPGNITEYTQIV